MKTIAPHFAPNGNPPLTKIIGKQATVKMVCPDSAKLNSKFILSI
jgi:hypothetical protein